MPDTPTDRELSISLLLDAPRPTLYRCWTEPALLVKWFAPEPWTTLNAELDVRPGGQSRVVMKSPEGEEFPSHGVYLDVIPDRRLVFTDAYVEAWIPSDKPFFTAVVTFDDEAGKTRYSATARHWSDLDRNAHEKMGFHDGWTQCARQLEALARTV